MLKHNYFYFYFLKKKIGRIFGGFPHKFAISQGLNIIREKNLCLSFNFLISKKNGRSFWWFPPQIYYPLKPKHHSKKGSCFFL